MKKRIILSALLIITLCFCLIGGATFALFTSESNVNIAVTIGAVKVEASVQNLKAYSLNVEQTPELEIEKVFENGGTVSYENGILKLDRITPGDKVLFDIIIKNNSNIDIKYRVKWFKSNPLDNVLMSYIIDENNNKVNLDNVDWIEWKASSTEKTIVLNVGVELPITAMNDYQDNTSNITFVVEAVQKNGSDLGYVFDEEDLKAAVEAGNSEIILGDDIVLTETLNINQITKLNGNGNTISRSSEFTGTMINVSSSIPASGTAANLTLENVILDGGALWSGEVNETLGRGTRNDGVTATGSLVVANNNTSIVLGNGAVLQNNDGANAVNLGIRIGATLTIDGGEIINNRSSSGAIYGGGHITLNSGKISNNNSTDLAGAIRMVSSCNLTINGGEINNNYAATNGGAIWGYGSSTYNFNGGSMSNNASAGIGGAIYTGDYSVININNDFELCNNKAATSGAIRLTNHVTLNMNGGTVSGNTDDNGYAMYGWDIGVNMNSGVFADKFEIDSGITPSFGLANITGLIYFNVHTNHNTVNLKQNFNGFKFTVNESRNNFAAFNFKPAEGYTYVEGDEEKLICLNDGYETYWDATTSTFRLKSTNN